MEVFIGFLFALIEAWEMLNKNKITSCCEDLCTMYLCCLRYRFPLDWTLKILNLIFLSIALSLSKNSKSFFAELGQSQCSDEATNQALANFAVEVEDYVYSKNKNAIIVLSIAIVVEIAYSVYKLLKKGR